LDYGFHAFFLNVLLISFDNFLIVLTYVIPSYSVHSSSLLSIILYLATVLRKCISAVSIPLTYILVTVQNSDPYTGIDMGVTPQKSSKLWLGISLVVCIL
jgi:hypothetical protein